MTLKTATIELYPEDRDFILDIIYYALFEETIEKLKNAQPEKDGVIICTIDEYELEQLIGNLSLEANHNKKRSIQEKACDIAEALEAQEYKFKHPDKFISARELKTKLARTDF